MWQWSLLMQKKALVNLDENILNDVISKGKMIIIVNKWDLIKRYFYHENIENLIKGDFKALDHYPILFISTLTKQRIHRVLSRLEVFCRGRNGSTKGLNEVLSKILAKNPPPLNKVSNQICYSSKFQPVVIALYVNHPKK